MSLTNKGNFIISTTNTPSSTEIANQYTAAALKLNFESMQAPDSGYTDDGEYHAHFTIKNRRKLEITMPAFKIDTAGTAMSNLISSIQGKTYWITYYDYVAKAEKTIHVFTDASAAECFSGVLFTNGVWQGLTFVATELKGETA